MMRFRRLRGISKQSSCWSPCVKQSIRSNGHVCRSRAAKPTRAKDDLSQWEEFFDSDDLGLPEELAHIQAFQEDAKQDGVVTQASGFCYGCGMSLQTEFPDGLGYVNPEVYIRKAAHHQKAEILCSRCVALSHGKMVPAVEDFTQKKEMIQRSVSAASASVSSVDEDDDLVFRGERLLTPDQLRDQLKGIRDTKAVCVMMIDILDASGSFLGRLRNIVGSNPVIVIATKVDLLPKGTDFEQVQKWLEDFVEWKRLSCLSVHLISSKTGEGMDQTCRSILSQRLGRDVFVVGAANVGKSAFVRRILQEMSSFGSRHYDAQASVAKRRMPMESAMPGTTLGMIRLAAFSSGGALFDTPGLHMNHRIPHMLTPEELRLIHPRRRLRPYVAASPFTVAEATGGGSDRDGNIVPCATYLWGALLRIDVMEAGPEAHLVFFGTGAMQVWACNLLEEDDVLALDDYVAEHSKREDDAVNPVVGVESVVARGGLRLARRVDLCGAGDITTLADICVSGLPGWVAVVSGFERNPLRLRIWAPRGVEVHVRPPMPCPTPVSVAHLEAF